MTKKIAIVGTIAVVVVTAIFMAKERLYAHREDMEKQWKQISDELEIRKGHLKNINAQIQSYETEIAIMKESISAAKNNQAATNHLKEQSATEENDRLISTFFKYS